MSELVSKLAIWDDQEAERQLGQRLKAAKEWRQRYERQWLINENSVFNTRGLFLFNNYDSSYFSDLSALGSNDVEAGSSDVGVNYIYKNLKYIHSQLSSNPPSVIARPATSDADDRRKADAADRAVQYLRNQYDLQDKFDLFTLPMLVYGTGWMKHVFDSTKGDILDVDEEGNLLLEGDFSITNPSVWDIWSEPAANFDDCRYIFEQLSVPYEQACMMFPGKEDLLKQYLTKDSSQVSGSASGQPARRNTLNQSKFDSVNILQYWEKGLNYNGFKGRFCYLLPDGKLLSKVMPNPHRFYLPKEGKLKELMEEGKLKELPDCAYLPYTLLTDGDMPDSYLGRSAVDFSVGQQDMYNRLLNCELDILEAHGVVRIIKPQDAELKDDSLTNSPHVIVEYSGQIPPSYMEPMPFPQQLNVTKESLKAAIDDSWGVNESMFGQQSREQATSLMQYATNQGNMIRRRMFNKYTRAVKNVYQQLLSLIVKHWKTKKMIKMLGKEKAFESMELKGTDVDGGFDLVVEYGTSFSLDPLTRREEILTLQPLFEKAGIDAAKVLSMLKLTEVTGLYDRLSLAADRQREIFEEMTALNVYIEPKELQDHKNMLAYAYEYVMTSEFKYLKQEAQQLIEQHIKAREALAAQGAQPAAGTGAPGPAPEMGSAGQPPIAPGMAAGQATTDQVQPGGDSGQPAPAGQ